MTANPPLTGSHLHTYDAIFQHPLSHNLNWRAVHSLMGKLGEATEEHNGHLKVTRNGQTLILYAGHGHVRGKRNKTSPRSRAEGRN